TQLVSLPTECGALRTLGRSRRSRLERLPIGGRGNDLPTTGLARDFNVVFPGHAVAELPVLVAAPDGSIGGRDSRPPDRDPTAGGRRGDPASAVAVLAVIQMCDLVDRGVGEF